MSTDNTTLLAGKTALVTGAGRGIGKAIALELARCGANIAFTNQDPVRTEATSKEIAALGREHLGDQVDASDGEAIHAMVEQVVERWGKIDILINNAGITRDKLLLRMTAEDWRKVMQVNLDSMFYAVKAVSRHMLRQRGGRIVNLSSVVGHTGNAGQINYSSSKSAVIGFTKSVAQELGSRNITCNAVAPGFIETDMTDAIEAAQKDALLANIPLGRMGSADEVATTVRFLCSNDASYITGTTLHVNGGLF